MVGRNRPCLPRCSRSSPWCSLLASTTLKFTDLVAVDPAAGRVSVPPLLDFPDITRVVAEERAEMGIGTSILM
jgi:hypothetical protein